jgi:hypothetical protein
MFMKSLFLSVLVLLGSSLAFAQTGNKGSKYSSPSDGYKPLRIVELKMNEQVVARCDGKGLQLSVHPKPDGHSASVVCAKIRPAIEGGPDPILPKHE